MSFEEATRQLRQFVSEREWEQFHTPENLAKSISIEAAELLECYQWNAFPESKKVIDELADVRTYWLLLAEKLEVDPLKIVSEKLESTRDKYPVGKSRGKSAKYDQL